MANTFNVTSQGSGQYLVEKDDMVLCEVRFYDKAMQLLGENEMRRILQAMIKTAESQVTQARIMYELGFDPV